MSLVVAISRAIDGDMKIQSPDLKNNVIDSRTNFLSRNGIRLKDTTLVGISYAGSNYTRFKEIDGSVKGAGMKTSSDIVADALVVRGSGHALFLPLADCVGAVIYDSNNSILMVSHLGRHSIEQNGGFKSIKYLVDNYGSIPKNLEVWLTPAPNEKSYPIHAMNNRGLKELAIEQLDSAGILSKNITDNPADTITDLNYFSHSEFLKGNRETDGRYAIVAMIKD